MADMQIAVRLRRKPGDDRFVAAGRKVRADDVADEILSRFANRRVGNRHDLIASVPLMGCGAPGLDKLARGVKSGDKFTGATLSEPS